MLIQPVIISDNPEDIINTYIEKVRTNSDLTTFDIGSPERAIIELLAFNRQEIVNVAKEIPNQVLINLLNFVGFIPRSGVKSSGTVTFNINVQTNLFSINAGYLLTDGTNFFETTTKLEIAIGDTVGTVPIICTENGSQGNIAAGTLTPVGIKYAQVTLISNSETTGGQDTETDEAAIGRSLLSYNTRQALITKADLQNSLISYGGLRLEILPGTNDNYQSEVGSMLLLTYGLSSAQKTDYLNSIKDRLALGVTAYIDDLPIIDMELSIDVRISEGALPTLVIDELFTSLSDYYNPLIDQGGLIWSSNIVCQAVRIEEVVGVTSTEIIIDGQSYYGDVPLDPVYAGVNLTKLTLNTYDGFNNVTVSLP